MVGGPLEPTHLLSVARQLTGGDLAAPVIPLEDEVVTATGRDDVIVPRNRTCIEK